MKNLVLSLVTMFLVMVMGASESHAAIMMEVSYDISGNDVYRVETVRSIHPETLEETVSSSISLVEVRKFSSINEFGDVTITTYYGDVLAYEDFFPNVITSVTTCYVTHASSISSEGVVVFTTHSQDGAVIASSTSTVG